MEISFREIVGSLAYNDLRRKIRLKKDLIRIIQLLNCFITFKDILIFLIICKRHTYSSVTAN